MGGFVQSFGLGHDIGVGGGLEPVFDVQETIIAAKRSVRIPSAISNNDRRFFIFCFSFLLRLGCDFECSCKPRENYIKGYACCQR